MQGVMLQLVSDREKIAFSSSQNAVFGLRIPIFRGVSSKSIGVLPKTGIFDR
jgi:hypothetical protein